MLMQSRTLSDLSVLLKHLPRRRLRLMGVVLVASFLQGLLDMLLVGLMARMVGLLAGVKLQDQIPGIRVFGGSLLDQAGWLIGLLIAAFWFTSIIRFGVSLMQSMLSAEIWNDLVNRVYANLMRQRYAFFTQNRTANLSESFNRVLNRISTAVISPLITIAGNLLSVVVLLVGVNIILGWKALLMFALMLMAYVVSSRLITPYLRLGTKQRVRYTRRINMILMESLRSMRDVQLYSADQYFTSRFSRDGVIAKRYDRLTRLLPDVPRYVIEPVAVTVLFAIGLGPSLMAGDMESVRESLPLISVILVTLLRISGPLQSMFRSVNKLRGGLPEIKDALDLLQLKPERLTLQSPGVPSPSGVSPRRLIQLDNVGFTYTGRDQPVLEGINLSIPVGSRIALVGRTGSGKTTLAHIILGLYTPSSGELCLDGIPLTAEEMPAWQANCALVPQDIRLLDTSVRENIAFGQSGDDIDDDEVWNALAAAQFDDVVSQMPYGLYTMIGENGVKLSGGQRQRLSLARAFYRKASVLILDEATSALDNKTEYEVMQALDIVGRRCTTIVIAHRLSTVRKCDQVFEVSGGRIKASGSFEDLVKISDSFREMNRLEST
ncbi:ABC transporter ATP-binding protein [Synechococcus sp. HB1133]|uniref:ABC transporter ATP-binding protein n=1 Tax=unclassified Synechococcus TaxID=2626047 RepID=UPI00140D3D35|nr:MULTISPECIES: ABC transporter ATP-binding protein [unclassified Synechococcus]MCB4393893.1 ABC transporter ATP-binding protein [Synechococcus sp. PH41509]MCB4421373.1 ABC transporter ATP-binding protein [Synechococcus sp. HB1133]MCB4431276.1 ABC transporter ATP-binding protein [Synechococcus sp. HBA1120]NHI80315.1 ABC transporter ATP-binding protein [Synechococcus sp. HB1133]